jgi:hypothetical protein
MVMRGDNKLDSTQSFHVNRNFSVPVVLERILDGPTLFLHACVRVICTKIDFNIGKVVLEKISKIVFNIDKYPIAPSPKPWGP